MSRLVTEEALLQRRLRVGELVRRALSDVLVRGEIKDQAFDNCAISISEVRMSLDLKIATVFVVPLGGFSHSEILEKLKLRSRWLRHCVTRRVGLKFSPAMRFKLDTRFDDDQRIASVLRSEIVAQDLLESH